MFHKQFYKSWWKWPKGNLLGMRNASLKYKTESQRTWYTRTFGGRRRGTGWGLYFSVSQKTIWKENNRPLSIQPKIPEISNATDHVGLVRPENSGPALKMVLFDRSGYLWQLDRNVPLHLSKLLSPVPLFCVLLSRTITKRAVAWVVSLQPECTVPLGMWNRFRNFEPGFLLNGKRP